MRHLFKPQAIGLLCLLALALGAVSCDKEVEPAKLPDAQEIHCEAGDHPTLTFTVSSSWQLSSNAIWCRFITSSGEVQDMSGNQGTHTITLRITDEQIKMEPTFAEITMKMDGHEAVIATVERAADQYYMNLYDVNDTKSESIELGYGQYIPFRIEANFRFAAVDYPEWVEFSNGGVTGAPGQVTESMARIVTDGHRERYPITVEDGYKVTFSDESGENTFTFPITYSGMGEDDISFSGPTNSNFGWEVSLDGKCFRQQDETTDTTITFENELKFTIATLNDDFEILCFEQVVDRGIPSYEYDVEWIDFNNETMALTVDASEAVRYGMVMVMPRATYNNISSDIAGNIFEIDYTSGIGLQTVKYDYLKYVLIEFTQTDFAERDPYDGMYVYHSLTICEIPCTPYTTTSVMEQYDVTEAYTCPFPIPVDNKRPNIIINPRIEGWDTESVTNGTATVEFYYKGERLKQSEGEYELGENKDEVMAVQLIGPKGDFDEEVYALFKVGNEPRKLLVVTPPTI